MKRLISREFFKPDPQMRLSLEEQRQYFANEFALKLAKKLLEEYPINFVDSPNPVNYEIDLMVIPSENLKRLTDPNDLIEFQRIFKMLE